MNDADKILNEISIQVENNVDYKDDKGYLVCGNCNTRKEQDIKIDKSFEKKWYMEGSSFLQVSSK